MENIGYEVLWVPEPFDRDAEEKMVNTAIT
jgi:hypothetical protein